MSTNTILSQASFTAMRDATREEFQHIAHNPIEFGYHLPDPAYDTLPIKHFEPVVKPVFSSLKKSIYLEEEQASSPGSA
jgi:hypothetical protein